MPILSAQTCKKPFLKKYKGQQGFTILEILVVLALFAIVATLIPWNIGGGSRAKIDSTLSQLGRAVRFALDESILRNSIVRVRFELDKEPIEFSVEYGTKANIVLPEAQDLSKLSLSEREKEIERMKKLDGQFSKVAEFEDGNVVLPDDIYIYGVGTTYYPNLITEGDVYLYFYPNGEKDSALVILTSPDEIVTFTVFPFEDRTEENYIPLTENDLANLDYALENKTKEIFEKWKKE